MARKFDAGYYVSEGFRSIFTHGFMSFAAVCMIVACLLIMGSFTLLAVNLNDMLGDFEAENEFLAYIDETVPQEDAKALQSAIEAIPNVSGAVFITKEDALEDFKEGRQTNALLDELPAQVLRDRYSIRVHDLNEMQSTVDAVEDLPNVVNVRAALDIAKGFVLVRNIASGVAIVLIAILAVVSLFIISNTIKLATFYRREEIAIMKMCGATNWFIRWPFLVEGIILGICGGLVAYVAQWGVYGLIGKAMVESGILDIITMIPFQNLNAMLLTVFLLVGFVIGGGGSALAIRKFLKV